jgi:hypothetical protein
LPGGFPLEFSSDRSRISFSVVVFSIARQAYL